MSGPEISQENLPSLLPGNQSRESPLSLLQKNLPSLIQKSVSRTSPLSSRSQSGEPPISLIQKSFREPPLSLVQGTPLSGPEVSKKNLPSLSSKSHSGETPLLSKSQSGEPPLCLIRKMVSRTSPLSARSPSGATHLSLSLSKTLALSLSLSGRHSGLITLSLVQESPLSATEVSVENLPSLSSKVKTGEPPLTAPENSR